MPTEPQSKMHETLKAFASKRRQQLGPPVDLHPAARRLLHSEIAKVLGGAGGASSMPPLFVVKNLWPRLLAGAGILALLVLGAGIWLRINQKEEAELALLRQTTLKFPDEAESENLGRAGSHPNEVAERVRGFQLGAAPTSPAVPPIISASAPSVRTQTDLSISGIDGLSLGKALQPEQTPVELATLTDAPTNIPGTALSETPTPSLQAANLTVPASRTEEVTVSAPAETFARSAAKLVRRTGATGDEMRESSSDALYFQQLDSRARYRRNFNSPPPPNVLNNFQMVPIGTNLRVLDADGSVYEGTLQQLSAPQQQVSPETAHQAFRFETAGTNLTLNQRVVFTGEFMPNSNGDVAGAIGGAGARATALTAEARSANPQRGEQLAGRQLRERLQAVSGSLTNPPISGARVEGKASLADKSELKIEAQQVVR